ncbi:membrane protein (plasmid) [Fulvitalea axinellae]|uniref:Membrane protein n=1 Tax=Fulvitalea axinellae TaxID=1182444 RepID=A0AAU9D828_9BACT|nr:membrane protein [Fulvitalea axinellae]
MARIPGSYLIFIVCLGLLGACNTRKYLMPGQLYYNKSEVKVFGKDSTKVPISIKTELDGLLISKQRGVILGSRVGVWMYEQRKRHKPILGFIYKQFAKPPLYFDYNKVSQVSRLLENRMGNHGYFGTRAEFDTVRHRNGVDVKYRVYPTVPYRVKNITLDVSTETVIDSLVREASGKTLLKPGQRYNLARMRKERTRITEYVRNRGYFFFNDNDILFLADSTVGHRQVDLTLTLKKDIQAHDTLIYHTDTARVYFVHHEPPDSLKELHLHSSVKKDVRFFSKRKKTTRLKVIYPAIYMKPDSLYRYSNYQRTIRHLSGLGVFKFVDLRENANDSTRIIQPDIFLTPGNPKSVQVELGGSTNSEGYAGPELSLAYNHQNLFRGAEHFTFQLKGGFLKEFGESSDFDRIYWLGVNANLNIPRFIRWIGKPPETKNFIPLTKIGVSVQRYDFSSILTLDYINTTFGYQWQKTSNYINRFDPIFISYQRSPNSDSILIDLKKQFPLLGQSIENQLIIGSSYKGTFYSSLDVQETNRIYDAFTIDVSGNILYGLFRITDPSRDVDKEPYKVLGLDFSQYLRFTNDFRYYLRTSKRSNIATRLLLGLGVPWGNSKSLPFIMQYFIGGPNDLRGFRTRTVGPGSYQPPDSTATTFFGQGGDIKLEGNIEYRFPIAGIFKGAVFVDAGNIWLANNDPDRPGGKFSADKFYKEIAVSSGAGLRLDFKVVVIRLDWGIPLRKPYLPEGKRWVIDKIDIGSSSWRSKNIIFNFSLGYPF